MLDLESRGSVLSEHKGADQLCSYCEADLCLCFRIGKSLFSHGAAHLIIFDHIHCNLLALR